MTNDEILTSSRQQKTNQKKLDILHVINDKRDKVSSVGEVFATLRKKGRQEKVSSGRDIFGTLRRDKNGKKALEWGMSEQCIYRPRSD